MRMTSTTSSVVGSDGPPASALIEGEASSADAIAVDDPSVDVSALWSDDDWANWFFDHVLERNVFRMKDAVKLWVNMTMSKEMLKASIQSGIVFPAFDESTETEEIVKKLKMLEANESALHLILSKYNNPPQVQNINHLLAKLAAAKHSSLRSLNVANNNMKPAYFVFGLGSASFRHAGISGSKPDSVYLAKETNVQSKTAVYMTASGYGKTAELAGSAYVRDKHLTIYFVPGDDVVMPSVKDEDPTDYKARRHEKAKKMLASLMAAAYKNNKAVFDAIANRTNKDEEKLTLVVAIDEASACPLFVRAIIADTDAMRSVVVEKLVKVGVDESSIVFSVAGTGASRGSIGSDESKWMVCKTSALMSPSEVFGVLRKAKHRKIPTLAALRSIAPVLHTLATHNARMASIVVDLLDEEAKYLTKIRTDEKFDEYYIERNESTFVARTMSRFIDSNGLEPTKDNVALGCCIGAQVLATHLLSTECCRIPNKVSEREELAICFKYGIGVEFDEGTCSMIDLVARYGMITPSSFPELGVGETLGDKELARPFVVDEAMQLVALHLLKMPDDRRVLEPGFAGFEVIATQMIKGALAASSVIKWDKRKNVQEVLEKIGFVKPLQPNTALYMQSVEEHSQESSQSGYEETGNNETPSSSVDDGANFDSANDDDDYESGEDDDGYVLEDNSFSAMTLNDMVWADFANIKVVRHTADKSYLDGKDDRLRATYMQKYPMTVLKVKEKDLSKVNGDVSQTVARGDAVLIADDEVIKRLLAMKPIDQASDDLGGSLLPFATISYGNSDRADGYVTFFASGSENGDTLRHTVMVQAKDYQKGPYLDFSGIAKNVKRCRSPQLDVGFGSSRLMCVAARKGQLGGRPKKHKRDFIGFGVDGLDLLGGLMAALYERRKKKSASFEMYHTRHPEPATEPASKQ